MSKLLFGKECPLLLPFKKKGVIKYKNSDTYGILEFLYTHIKTVEGDSLIDDIMQKIIEAKSKHSLAVPGENSTEVNFSKTKYTPSFKAKKANKNKQKVQLDKEILKILRLAVRDLKDTRKALYLNIINSFIQNDVELTEEIFEVFQILDDKKGLSIGCLKSMCKTIGYIAKQIAVNERVSPTKILNSLSSWLASPIDKTTTKSILKAMHSVCEAMKDFSYEDTLFAKHLVYLKDHKDNFQKAVELNKTMTVMANMIEIFPLQSETNEEYWKLLHLFLEVILDKCNRQVNENQDCIRIISGALLMLSKIWIKCPSILRNNTTLLNFFWFFTSQA